MLGAIHNALVHSSSPRVRRWWERCHRTLGRRVDPDVCVQVGKRKLWMKFSHPLPFMLAQYEHYDTLLPRLGAALRRQHGDLVLIDVGANIGDTASLILDQVEARILAVEPDPDYFAFLQKNTAAFEQVTCVAAALTDIADETGPALTKVAGTAFMSKAGGVTLDSLIESHPAFAAAHLLKVDTDGFDYKVLQGARRLLTTSHPAIFFELSPEHYEKVGKVDPTAVFPFLRDLGYTTVALYDNEGWLICSGVPGDGSGMFEQLVHYARTRGSYFDVLAFHASSADFAREFLAAERELFRPVERAYLDAPTTSP